MVYNETLVQADFNVAKGIDVIMRIKRSILITIIVVLAFGIYAGIHLINTRENLEAILSEQHDVRKEAAELQIKIDQLEHEIENYDDPDVKANIARTNLGLVLPGEIVFFNYGSSQDVEG